MVWVYLVGNGAAAADVLDTVTARVLALDDVALLEDLDDDILLLGAAKLGLKSALGGSVEGSLVAVVVGDEDLEAVDDLSKGNAPVLLPVLHSLSVLSEDNEVVAIALVVDSDLGSVSAHVDVCLGFEWGWWCGGSVGSKFVR
jgi:hypothetical protein